MKTFKVTKVVYNKSLGNDLKTVLLTQKVETIAEHLSFKDAKEKRKDNKGSEITPE
jgi:hypothetical protein